MPIYVWKCSKCDNIVEELRKIGEDKPPKGCGSCGDTCACGKGPCEFVKQLTTANFRIDKAAGD